MAGNGEIKQMASLLQSTLNTRALPIGNLRYIRSDYDAREKNRPCEPDDEGRLVVGENAEFEIRGNRLR